MKKITKRKAKGIGAASGVALHQGLEGIIFTFLGLFFLKDTYESQGFSIGTLTIKELFTFLLLFLLIKPSRIFHLFKKGFLDKNVRFFLMAGILGTTIGNLFYFMAIQMGGAGYGPILTSLYPIFSMGIIRVFSKNKTTWKVLTGAGIAVLSSILFTLLPVLISNSSDFSTTRITGIILGVGAAFFWAVEGLLIHFGLRKKENVKLKQSDIVALRSIGTTFTTLIILCPLFTAINSMESSWGNPYTIIGDIFTKPWAILILVLISINLVILRLMHVYAIKVIGPRLTAIIDTNNFLVPPFISIFLAMASGLVFKDSITDPLFVSVTWWSWLLIIPILIGVLMVVYYQKEEFSESLEKVKDV